MIAFTPLPASFMDTCTASHRKTCRTDIWQLICLFQLILIGASHSSFQFRSVLEKIFFQLATSAPHPPRGHSLLTVIHFDAPFISAHSNCQQNCHSFHGLVFALHLINSFTLHLQCTTLFLLRILGFQLFE